jgi:hypothetical protein
MKKNIWIVPLVFLYMVGCSSAVKLTDATTGSRARVRFVAEVENYTQNYTVVYGYQAENCKDEEKWMVLRKGHYPLSPKKRLGIPLWHYHKNAAKEFHVSTERPLIVMFKSYCYIHSISLIPVPPIFLSSSARCFICDVPIIYQLEEKDYEIKFIWPSHRTGCSADIFEIVKFERGVRKKSHLKTFNNKMSFDYADCNSAFEKRRRHWSDFMIYDRTYK